MKRFYLTLLMTALGLMVQAQSPKISVASFDLLENDLKARTEGTKRIDQNGNLSALIRVETTVRGQWSFDVGMLGIVGDIEMQNNAHPAEIWVYVPYGVRRVFIQHSSLGSLEYKFPIDIEKGRTYRMKLITGEVIPLVMETFTQQYLVFHVTPKDATVTVDGDPLPVDEDGRAEKLVDIGKKCNYKVEAKDYHSKVGYVVVDNQKTEQDVALLPAFGFLKIDGNRTILSGATIRIDKADGSDALNKAVRLASGQHEVMIVHPKYKPFTRMVTIVDGETNTMNVDLNANYSNVTVKADDNAEIWVNNERKGVGLWTGDLVAGEYIFECRKLNHRTTQQRMTITDNMSGKVVTLPSPTPINGRLSITSKPSGAKVVIDGKEMGETPLLISAILVGEHSMRLEKQGCAPVSKTITIEENKPLNLEEKLDTGRSVLVKTDRRGDKIYVDGDYVGETPYETPLSFGNHTIKVVRNGIGVPKQINIRENSINGQEMVFEFGRMITIKTDQDGDEVMVDGNMVGYAPVNVDLPHGNHVIRAERGKKFAEKEITVQKTGGDTYYYLLLHGESASEFVSRGVNFVTADFTYNLAPLTSYGATFGMVKTVGWFLTASSNFSFDALKYTKIADSNGLVDGYYPSYSGVSYTTRYSVMAGMVVRLGCPLYLRFGAGYGSNCVSYVTDSGDLVKISNKSVTGVDATAGLQLNLKGFTMSVDAVTTSFQTFEVKVGLGYCWKRK